MKGQIVFICIDWFHPSYKAGGPVQSIANLVTEYHGVCFKIYCGNRDLDGSLNQGVVFDEWNNYNDYTQVWYASDRRRSAGIIQGLISEVKPDILLITGVYSWHFNLLPLLVAKVPVKIVSARGMLHPGALSQKSLRKRVYLSCWKIMGLHRKYIFHATDEQEERFIREVFGVNTKVMLAGNYPRVLDFQPTINKPAGELRLISIALISPMKNLHLVLEALQQCQSRILYCIYGPVKDSSYWQECLRLVDLLPANVRFAYEGELLPTQISSVLQAYDVFILPSKSENFGHAIFEALSAGKPVITSYGTPFNHLLEAEAGFNVRTDHAGEISAAIEAFASMGSPVFGVWNKGAHAYSCRVLDVERLKTQYDVMFSATV